MFKLGSVIFSNVLKEVSSAQQGIFFVKQDKRVKSRFWLFNLCNSEKKGKIGLHGGGKKFEKNVFGIRLSV